MNSFVLGALVGVSAFNLTVLAVHEWRLKRMTAEQKQAIKDAVAAETATANQVVQFVSSHSKEQDDRIAALEQNLKDQNVFDSDEINGLLADLKSGNDELKSLLPAPPVNTDTSTAAVDSAPAQ